MESLEQSEPRVALVSDLEAVANELFGDMVWMVRPRLRRGAGFQRLGNLVEVTDLDSINLAKTTTFETV